MVQWPCDLSVVLLIDTSASFEHWTASFFFFCCCAFTIFRTIRLFSQRGIYRSPGRTGNNPNFISILSRV